MPTNTAQLRPHSLDEYIGQTDIKAKLRIYINSALTREAPLDHLLLYGPPGLGKTTLAMIIANELHVKIHVVNGGNIERVGDLASLLVTIKEREILFVDEIHRLPKIVEEVLYGAMEDFMLNVIVNNPEGNKVISLPLPPFTLIGATTSCGGLSLPLRTRFSIIENVRYYTNNDLREICQRTVAIFGFQIDKSSASLLASLCRGTPRVLNNYLKQLRDYCLFKNETIVRISFLQEFVKFLQLYNEGLTKTDIQILQCLKDTYQNVPTSMCSIAKTIGEDYLTIMEVNEPFLLEKGFLLRTKRGRVVSLKGLNYLSNLLF